MKRIKALICAATIVFSGIAAVIPAEITAFAEDTKPIRGECGENLTWVFDHETKTVTISGQGAMARFSKCGPWEPWKNIIENVIIEEGVTNISDFAFMDCRAMVSVTIPEGVTSIGDRSFYWCTSLKTVSVPDSLEKIDIAAFACCTALASIEASGNGETFCSVDGVLFSKDKKSLWVYPAGSPVTEYHIPDGVTKIEEYAFDRCLNLLSVTFPESVKEIKPDAFNFNNNLKSVSFSEGLESIGLYSFQACWSLEKVDIPASVTKISDGAFSYCTSLTEINVNEQNPEYCSIDGILFSKDQTLLHTCPGGRLEQEYTVPAFVTKIGDRAFDYCIHLNKITIPASVTEIGIYVFTKCGYDAETKTTNFTIYGYAGSCAEQSAKDERVKFVAIDDQPAADPPEESRTGDLDGDGEITVDDAQNVLAAYTEGLANDEKTGLTPVQIKACDIDGDSKITSADAQYILIYYTENTVADNPTTWEQILKK